MSVAQRAALVPALALLIATLQLIVSSLSTLTPWKGGGFGMYSELHPNKRQLWLIPAQGPSRLILDSTLTQSSPACAPSRHQACLRWPRAHCLCQLKACIGDGEATSALVAYEPKFHVQHRQLERVELARCSAMQGATP